MTGVRVEVKRGGRVESVHVVDVAAVGADGRVVARAGDVETAVFSRSSIKPFQALPLVEEGGADRFGLTDRELALCCASHSGEPEHIEIARSILRRIGLDESDLACGAHAPFSDEATAALRRSGVEPGRLHNNCSGKHAGMLAFARASDWPTAGYHEADHPVQQRIRTELARWTGVAADAMPTGIDGCGVVTFAVPLTALALGFARLAAAAEAPDAAAGRVVRAMTRHPFVVAGSDRLCTRLMEETGGRILAKVGAEGVYGAAALDTATGIALKVRDGARRAAEVALLGVLRALELVDGGELEALAAWAEPPLRNTRGERVGELVAVVDLEALDRAGVR